MVSVYTMRIFEKTSNMFWGMVKEAVVFVSSAGISPNVGSKPRGPQISSETQRALVESKAGFNFTNTTIKRFVDPARTVSAQDLWRAVSGPGVADIQGAAGATSHYTTILRNGNTYNLKVVYHAQSNTIYHFHYSRSAMGDLPKIKK